MAIVEEQELVAEVRMGTIVVLLAFLEFMKSIMIEHLIVLSNVLPVKAKEKSGFDAKRNN